MIRDPRLFNFIIMALYACAAVRWAIAGLWMDCFYWGSALALIIAVTFR